MSETEFSWGDKEDIVVRSVDAVAVYANQDGDVVIRRMADFQEQEDAIVVVPRNSVDALVKAIKAAKAASKPNPAK